MRMRSVGALALSFVLVMGLAACGDDDDAGEAVDLVDVEPGGSGDDGGGDDDAEDGDGDAEGGDDEAQDGDEDALPESVNEECAEFAEAAGAFADITTGQLDLDEVADTMQAFADAAPDEIADDVQLFADAYINLANSLADAGIDVNDPSTFSDPEAVGVLTEALEVFSTPEFTDAVQNVSEFCATA